MNTRHPSPEPAAAPDEPWLDALLQSELGREAAELGDDAAFSAALLSRLPKPLQPVATQVAPPLPWLTLLNSISLAAVLALLLLIWPDPQHLLSAPLSLASSEQLTQWLKALLPSLALLALLSWWSWQYVREQA